MKLSRQSDVAQARPFGLARHLCRLSSLLILAPALGGCGSQGGSEAGGGGGRSGAVDEAALAREALLAEEAALGPGPDALIATAMPGLVDPAKARYRNVRPGIGGGACGEVSTPVGKAQGPFRPFVITREGVAVINATPAISFRDPTDVFPDLYMRWCATPEELQGLAPELSRGPLDEALEASNLANATASIVEPPALPEAPPAVADPPAPPAPAAEKIDRFEEAVRRKQQP